MPDSLRQRCIRLMEELQIATAAGILDVRPLDGGVASDIGVVTLAERQIVVKFALAKLKVAEDWQAPVHRNRAEFEWLRFARATTPANAPGLYGRSETLQGFAMEYLHGPDVSLWKSLLLAGQRPSGEAARVGHLLGQLHATSTQPGFDRSPFHNRDDFHALRLDPYLIFTAGRYPALAGRLTALATALHGAGQVLVHGDVSPKNILLRSGAPVLLDAECATMGDASFDLAFCLNHLVLKAIHLPESRAALFSEALALWEAYAPHVRWEDPADLQARIVALLPALMLARVDGKSPVEYLSLSGQALVRRLSIPRIAQPLPTLAAFVDTLRQEASMP